MNRLVLISKVGSDGTLHLHLPIGADEADKNVQITVEPVPGAADSQPPAMGASDLLRSGLVGMWADRTDIDDSHAFARRLRGEAQSRRKEA